MRVRRDRGRRNRRRTACGATARPSAPTLQGAVGVSSLPRGPRTAGRRRRAAGRLSSLLAPEERTPLIEAAIRQGVDFLFSVDPASGAYPTGYSDKPSRNWWKLGFPVFYVTDLLQIVEALDGLGYRDDPRLANALALVRQKQDPEGRWTLDYHYNDKTWVGFGAPGQPNPWVTLRALRVLGEG